MPKIQSSMSLGEKVFAVAERIELAGEVPCSLSPGRMVSTSLRIGPGAANTKPKAHLARAQQNNVVG